MEHMNDAKKKYDEILVPIELSKRIESEVKKAQQRKKRTVLKKFSRYTLGAVASLAIICTVGLNTSVVFANAVGNIPVIGAVARVLTSRSYETKTDDLKIAVEIPSIDMISEDFATLEESVNKEIYQLCETYAEEAVKRAEEYRKAFLDTGGTPEEWEAHKIGIKVWYEVKTQTDHYLSLAIRRAENWNSVGEESRYYNFDLKSGKQITLEDVLGKDYAQLVVDKIRSEMEERERQESVSYFEEKPLEITKNTKFYMNQDGYPVVVFEKYEIAPGAFGKQEFEIRP